MKSAKIDQKSDALENEKKNISEYAKISKNSPSPIKIYEFGFWHLNMVIFRLKGLKSIFQEGQNPLKN